VSRQVTFKAGVEIPQDQWKREGKAEWPAMLTLKLPREHALRLNREIAAWLDGGERFPFETVIPGEVSEEPEEKRPQSSPGDDIFGLAAFAANVGRALAEDA